MTEQPWRPLFDDGGEGAEQYDALEEGVPPWLASSLAAWIRDVVLESPGAPAEKLRLVERRLRWQINWDTANYDSPMKALFDAAADETGLLKLTDFCLAYLVRLRGPAVARTLESLLVQGGSAWTVGERAGSLGLVRRVPEGVQEAAEAMFSRGDAGRLLLRAWGQVFGMNPNPSEAYRLAVKAVEAACIPVVSPTNDRATLGTVVAQMEQQGDWSLPFDREDERARSPIVLVAMMRMLWHGQHDRHAGGNDLPLSVSQPAAETAVAGAVSLVQWFTSGAVARR